MESEKDAKVLSGDERKERLLSSGSFGKLVLALCLPTMIIMIVNVLYNMADLMFIGKTGDPNMSAAVSLCTPIFTLITGLGTLFGMGGCTFNSLALGKGEKERTKATSAFCFYGALIVGVILLIVLIAAARPIAKMLGATEATIGYAMQYIQIVAIGAPFMLFSGTYCNLIRADGSATQSMIANLSGTVLNIVLDAIFVMAAKMAVRGVALATVIGNAVSCLYLVIYLVRKKQLYVNPKYFIKDKIVCWRVIALGFAAAISNVLLAVSKIIANQLVKGYGVEATTGLGIAVTFSSMIQLLAMGICIGLQPAFSVAYSQKNYKRIKKLFFRTSVLCFAIGVVLLALGIPFKDALIKMFINNSEVISSGGIMVIGCLIAAPIVGLFQVCQMFLQATNRASFATVIAVLEKGGFYIPVLVAMAAIWKINGIAFTPPIVEIFSLIAGAILCIVWAKSWNKKKKEKITAI